MVSRNALFSSTISNKGRTEKYDLLRDNPKIIILVFIKLVQLLFCNFYVLKELRHTISGFFVPGFPKLTRFETHFKKVLKKYKKGVYKHLVSLKSRI